MSACKYPESICPHMTVLKGKSYCDATPCQLTGELPQRTRADEIRSMSNEKLANFLSKTFCHGMGTENILEWLQQPTED